MPLLFWLCPSRLPGEAESLLISTTKFSPSIFTDTSPISISSAKTACKISSSRLMSYLSSNGSPGLSKYCESEFKAFCRRLSDRSLIVSAGEKRPGSGRFDIQIHGLNAEGLTQ